eukprot:TRINITY_DN1577_c0_g1_i1.p1 TRINITY_DN1577_c0_g1~~TRINITY_DN1577_c0_g1_i1.p1  ORF type:complete len:265 (-),score=17.77 TRINITY_DN1577_c0_g1_i1:761-1555(-)
MRIVCALLLFELFVFGVRAYSCEWSDNEGQFNLSALENDVQDYRQSMGLGGQAYYLNACRSVVTTACKTANCAACQTWSGGQACLGTITTSSFQANGNSVALSFTGGDDGRSMIIDFVCDQSAGIGTPVFSTETLAKEYVFSWASQFACPISQTCNATSCGGCVATGADQCVWCLDSQSCSSMADFNASCTNWVAKPQYCPAPACSTQSTCTGCMGMDGCSWCLDTTSCIAHPSNPSVCPDIVSNVTYCPSKEYKALDAAKTVV